MCDIGAEACLPGASQEAILSGYPIWRQINERRRGVIEVDLEERTIEAMG